MWNGIPRYFRDLPKIVFKRELNNKLVDIFKLEDACIDTPTIISKVKLRYQNMK